MKTKTAGKEAWQEAMEAFEQAEHAQEERDRSNGLVYSLDNGKIRDFLESRCAGTRESPERIVIKAASRQALYQALNGLPPTQKRRIAQFFFQQKSYSKIARFEGVDESAVRHSVKRALIQLRKALKGTSISARDFSEHHPTRYVKHFHPNKETADRQNKSTPLINMDEGGAADEK